MGSISWVVQHREAPPKPQKFDQLQISVLCLGSVKSRKTQEGKITSKILWKVFKGKSCNNCSPAPLESVPGNPGQLGQAFADYIGKLSPVQYRPALGSEEQGGGASSGHFLWNFTLPPFLKFTLTLSLFYHLLWPPMFPKKAICSSSDVTRNTSTYVLCYFCWNLQELDFDDGQ